MRLKPLHLALCIVVLDALWAKQALSAVPRYESSSVSMASLAVWSVLHLPAGLLGSLLLKPFGILDLPPARFPGWAFGVYVSLALAQAFGLSYYLALRWQRGPKA